MKTKYKFIEFVEGIKGEWTCWNSKSGDYLGLVSFNKKWKEFELAFEPNIVFTVDCLVDAAAFISQLNFLAMGDKK